MWTLRNCSRGRRSETGDTLVEVLLALLVIGLTAAAILGAFATTLSATSEHRTLAKADAALHNFVEYATNQIQLGSSPAWVTCATTSSYTAITAQFNANPTLDLGYTAVITNVSWLQGSAASCPGSPAHAPPEDITAKIENATGTVLDKSDFVVSQPDAAQSSTNSTSYTLSRNAGLAAGGGSLTITAGTSGAFAGASSVNFGPTQVTSGFSNDGTAITVPSIPQESGSQYLIFISVTTPTGTTNPAPDDQFTYGPAVTQVSPNTGSPAGGTGVNIFGTGFTAASTVEFGTAAATVTSFNGNTSLTVKYPAGTAGTQVDVTVSNPTLPSAYKTSPTSSADHFSYGVSVTGISPTTGPAAGGTTVTIMGQGLTGATSVLFNGVSVTPVAGGTDTQVQAVSPAGSGTVDVQVVTPSGTTPATSADRFSYTGGSTTPVGLGIYLDGSSSTTATLSCIFHNSGNNACTISKVGCGGSVGFYVETVDGSGNPVAVTAVGGVGVLVSGASATSANIPSGSFSTYPSTLTAQLSPPSCPHGSNETGTVTLSATLNGSSVTTTITVKSN